MFEYLIDSGSEIKRIDSECFFLDTQLNTDTKAPNKWKNKFLIENRLCKIEYSNQIIGKELKRGIILQNYQQIGHKEFSCREEVEKISVL